MSGPDRASIRFVRALLPDKSASLVGDAYEAALTGTMVRLGRGAVEALCDDQVLLAGGGLCRPGPLARAWFERLRRPELRQEGPRLADIAPEALIDHDESPLARLAAGPEPFLLRHHVEAGERLRRLVERAHLSPRLTMSYNEARAGGGEGRNMAGDISDSALDARRRLDAIARALPADCAGVLFDVCGFLKGLQLVETERGWPRRSAKLVLRIGLEELARHFGLGPVATGTTSGTKAWMEERLPLIG